MSVWYKTYEDRVVEIIHNDPETMPDPETWSEVPEIYRDYITTDYVIDSEGAVVPPSLDYFEQQLFTKLAAVRWEHQSQPVSILGNKYSPKPEDMGIMKDTIDLGEDYESQPSNRDAVLKDGADPVYPVFATNWKAVNGFVLVNLETLRSVARVLASHVQACFANESRIVQNIKAAETAEQKYEELNTGLIDRPWSIYILPSFDPLSSDYEEAPAYVDPNAKTTTKK